MQNKRLISETGEGVLQQIKSSVRGAVLVQGDEGYDLRRKLYNEMIDISPGVVIHCMGVADVISAVNIAREHQLLVSVRGGGHNVAGWALCDGGLVIDLSLMKGIRVDPAEKTVRAQCGVTWNELDYETQAFGLATTGGTVSSTGISGLTLGGGIGWLMRRFGLSCDNLLSADVVTASGELVKASANENPDLFWALRGGGGNFGIVTSFEYRLHPVTTVFAGTVIYPANEVKEAFRFYRDFSKNNPDELMTAVFLLSSPEGAPLLGFSGVYSGDSIEKGEELLKPLRTLATPVVNDFKAMKYAQAQCMLDPAYPPGLHNYWSADFVKGLDDALFDVLISSFEKVTSPLSSVVIEECGGQVSRVGGQETAFPHRDSTHNIALVARWTDPTEAERHIGWLRQCSEAMKPFSKGIYVNYLGAEGEDRVRFAYGSENYDRLAGIKAKFDPTNMFSRNQNIRPKSS